MKTYCSKWENLWKQARYKGSGVTRIETLNQLIEHHTFFHRGTIHPSIGDGKEPIKIEDISSKNFDDLKKIIKQGLVFVHNNSWVR